MQESSRDAKVKKISQILISKPEENFEKVVQIIEDSEGKEKEVNLLLLQHVRDMREVLVDNQELENEFQAHKEET